MHRRLYLFAVLLLMAGCASAPRKADRERELAIHDEMRRLSAELAAERSRLESLEKRQKAQEYIQEGSETLSSSDRMGSSEKTQDTYSPNRKKVSNSGEPIPPFIINVWIVVRKGRVYTHGLYPMEYPGMVRKLSHRKVEEGYEVLLVSDYNPDVTWSMILPKADGEYTVQARLVK